MNECMIQSEYTSVLLLTFSINAHDRYIPIIDNCEDLESVVIYRRMSQYSHMYDVLEVFSLRRSRII